MTDTPKCDIGARQHPECPMGVKPLALYTQSELDAAEAMARDEEREKVKPRTAVCPCGYAADADQYHAMYAPLVAAVREMRDALAGKAVASTDCESPEGQQRFFAACQRYAQSLEALATLPLPPEATP